MALSFTKRREDGILCREKKRDVNWWTKMKLECLWDSLAQRSGRRHFEEVEEEHREGINFGVTKVWVVMKFLSLC